MLDSRRLRDYLLKTSAKGASGLIPRDAYHIKIYDVSKLGGGVSSDARSFSLTYIKGGEEQTKSLVLRMIRPSIPPSPLDAGKCLKQFQVLTSLERINFPVPHVYLYESNPEILGKPFIIMDRVDGVSMKAYIERLNNEGREERIFDLVGQFARTLARLHALRWEYLDLESFGSPSDEYEYAKRQPTHCEYLVECLKVSHHLRVKEHLSRAVHWLQINAPLNPCEQYSLVHGDYCIGNIFVTNQGIIVMDWEWAEIGDPALDVGCAYHYVRLIPGAKNADKGEELSEYFISEYTRNFGRTTRQRLEFYKVVAALKMSIFYDAVLSDPLIAFRYYGAKSLPVFPFLRWLLKSWPQYFEDFLKEKVK